MSLYDWLQNPFKKKQESAPQVVQEGDDSASMAQERQERSERYAKQEQLRKYLKDKKSAEADGDFSKADREQAEKDFNKEYEEEVSGFKPLQKKDLDEKVNELEGSRRFVPEIGTTGYLFTWTDYGPAFMPGGFPAATEPGTLVHYNGTAWTVIAPPENEALMLFDSTAAAPKWEELPDHDCVVIFDNSSREIKTLEIPYSTQQLLMTNTEEGAALPLKFDGLRFTV